MDVGGADTYAGDHNPLLPMFNTTRNIVGTTIPIALHENGPIPDPNQLQSSGARWVLFNTWHTTWITNTSHQPDLVAAAGLQPQLRRHPRRAAQPEVTRPVRPASTAPVQVLAAPAGIGPAGAAR